MKRYIKSNYDSEMSYSRHSVGNDQFWRSMLQDKVVWWSQDYFDYDDENRRPFKFLELKFPSDTEVKVSVYDGAYRGKNHKYPEFEKTYDISRYIRPILDGELTSEDKEYYRLKTQVANIIIDDLQSRF